MRVVGEGVDCVNFVSAIFMDAGILEDMDFGSYQTTNGMDSVHYSLGRVLMKSTHCERVEGWRVCPDILQFGDIAEFRTRPESAHMGFYDGDELWHVISGRCVSKTPLEDWWTRLRHFYRVNKRGWKQNPGVLIK